MCVCVCVCVGGGGGGREGVNRNDPIQVLKPTELSVFKHTRWDSMRWKLINSLRRDQAWKKLCRIAFLCFSVDESPLPRKVSEYYCGFFFSRVRLRDFQTVCGTKIFRVPIKYTIWIKSQERDSNIFTYRKSTEFPTKYYHDTTLT